MTQRIAVLLTLLLSGLMHAQINPTASIELIPDVEYEIGGITVSGSENLDKTVVILLSGLTVGEKITVPGDELSKAIKNLWKQKLFEDISIYVTEKQGNRIFLEIHLSELPKLSKFYFTGVKKSWKDDLREELKLQRNTIVTENLIITSKNKIKRYFREKGYRKAAVDIVQIVDSSYANSVILGFRIKTGPRIKINEINFYGNEHVSDKELRKAMKETRQKGFRSLFKSSKLRKAEFEADRRAVIGKFNEKGYRDARILSDSIYDVGEGLINVDIYVEEGRKYYFRNITFLGNTKYSTELLRKILRIEKGDVFDSKMLNERVSLDMNGNDIATLYLDNGYLFSQVIPVETRVVSDSIDIEIRIREGNQATIAHVTVSGNDRTNDHVIYRELRTRPGDLFSKTQIQRTIRELAQLGYFDQQQLNVTPKPNPETGTVDLEYTVVERSTSQLELQGGWGGGTIIGTLGLNFNNFSARNILNGKSWRPLPSGDGQTISLRAQSNGRQFQNYSFSFTEPWLGGRKPMSFTVGISHSVQTNGVARNNPLRQELNITTIFMGLGQRLKWPDDYFTLFQRLEFRRFNQNNYPLGFLDFNTGVSRNINYSITLARNSTDVPIFPTKGSQISGSLEITPPFSFFSDKDFSDPALPSEDRYEWIEYQKWKFSADWFTPIAFKNKFVFRAHAEFGFLAPLNSEVGLPPFERFYLGGDGLQNFVIDGREVIGLRGYPNQSITPFGGGSMYNKFILEARFLISPNPNAQIFALTFFEGGNNYNNFWRYRPFELKRSAGAGLRIFMPMFGLLGIDIGYGFDPIPGTINPSGWQTHFIIGQQF
jgi:outer membrane protein insertion porin family